MDTVKTGKFIAQKRKEGSLTQQELADRLGISNKTVSKWECGNGMPEVSLMLPLCEILGISVNELLSGEELDNSYVDKAEKNLINLMQESQHHKIDNKILLIWHTVSLTVSIVLWFVLFGNSNIYQLGQNPTPLTLCYLIVGFLTIYATALSGGYAIVRKNKAILFTVLLFISMVCLLVCLTYQTLWLILPCITGIVICLVLNIVSLLKKYKS